MEKSIINGAGRLQEELDQDQSGKLLVYILPALRPYRKLL